MAYSIWRGGRRADRPHHRAEVMLRALSDGSADTSSVEVAVSTGDARLDAAVVRVASGARFTPGAVEGIPAPLWVRLPIELRTHAGEETPPVAAVVDSAALVRALAGVPAPPPLPQGMQPVFRVRFDGGAEGDTTVEAVYTQIPPIYADPVAAAIRASLKPDAHSWGWFFLSVVGGPQPEVREVPNYNRERNPALANGDSIRQMAATAMRRFEDRAAAETPPERPDSTGPDYEVAVRVRVLPDGGVDRGSIRLLDSTGEPELDREAARIAGEMRFQPAEVRGFPAIGWTVARVVFPNGARP